MNYTKRKSGVVVYRASSGDCLEVLLVSARKFKNSWVFPVGTVEKNESLEQAAARECLEESGYIVEIEEKVGSIFVNLQNSKNEFTFYMAKIIGEKKLYETDRIRLWVKLKELRMKIAPVFLPIAEKFIDMQKN